MPLSLDGPTAGAPTSCVTGTVVAETHLARLGAAPVPLQAPGATLESAWSAVPDSALMATKTITPIRQADETHLGGVELEDRVVVFTDVVGSTSLLDQHGDRAWIQTLIGHLDRAAVAAERFGGELMKSTGDGVLAVFDDCSRATRFAREMMRPCATPDGSIPIQLRIGMACGTVYRWHDDYFGRTVHLAARVCAAAEPGEILMSSTCIEACRELRSSAGAVRSMGLRGFSDTESVCTDRPARVGVLTGMSSVDPAIESPRGSSDGY